MKKPKSRFCKGMLVCWRDLAAVRRYHLKKTYGKGPFRILSVCRSLLGPHRQELRLAGPDQKPLLLNSLDSPCRAEFSGAWFRRAA